MFGRNLVKCDTAPVNSYVNPIHKPFNVRYCLGLEINKENFRKDLQRLDELWVLTPIKQSQYGMPVFIITKKEGTMRVLTDHQNVDHKIVRNPHPLPRIGKKISN